jgi:hypothetical protein
LVLIVTGGDRCMERLRQEAEHVERRERGRGVVIALLRAVEGRREENQGSLTYSWRFGLL